MYRGSCCHDPRVQKIDPKVEKSRKKSEKIDFFIFFRGSIGNVLAPPGGHFRVFKRLFNRFYELSSILEGI